MSSDTGESQVSAQADHENDAGVTSPALQSPVDIPTVVLDKTISRDGLEEDDQQELQSLRSGGNGMSFVRHRKAHTDDENNDSTSALALRPALGRPESPESTSIPDDTPSIQVGVDMWLSR